MPASAHADAASAGTAPADRALVEAARSGDRAAFARLYELYAPVVHGLLLTRIDRTEADDLTQDVFVRAMHSISRLRDPGAFGPWLCAMARNEAARTLRRRIRGALRLVGLACAPKPEPAAAGTKLEAEDVLNAIRRLPEAYRETLVLRLAEGLTGPEIAARTGSTHGSVRVNLTRGMKMLRECLALAEEAA